MAGLTSEGLEIKRLDSIIQDRIDSAKNQFGNDASTSVNDVLGRLLRIHAATEADLWELAEAVFNSFNPAYATGTALDRIVSYAGLQRNEAKPSTAHLLLVSDYLTIIPTSSVVTSSVTSHRFLTNDSAYMNSSDISGFTFEPIIAEKGVYQVTIGIEVFSYTASSSDTAEIISKNLIEKINFSSNFDAYLTRESTTLIDVQFKDVFIFRNCEISRNLTFKKIRKIISANCEIVGPVSQPENTLNIIATPVLGWDSVTNPVSATVGQIRESDEKLRLRFKSTKELNSRGSIDALYSNITNLPGVTDVQVYENVTMYGDVNGLPPKSFSAVIHGGNSLEIADTIWKVKPAGIQTHGNTILNVRDSQGLPHEIKFSRPKDINIYFKIDISHEENGSIAFDTDIKIAESIAEYFKNNYSVGDDVTYSRMYLPIQSVSGFQVDSLLIGDSEDNLGTSNINIKFDQIARVLPQNIAVTIEGT